MTPSPAKNVLAEIVAHKAQELIARKQQTPLSGLQNRAQAITPGSLETAIRASKKTPCILEIKPSSPSEGVLKAALNLPELLAVYQRYGAAFSVLTDAKYFGGSLALLSEVAQTVSQPVLCKDFIIDPYQVYEARCAGASAVLLIVKALSDAQLETLNALILQLGMTPLIEIQDEAELQRALAIQPTILLINNRNLQTLEMDFTTTERLGPLVPDSILKISASGIQSREGMERLKPFCNGFLIGSTLMKEPDAESLDRKLEAFLQ